MKYPIVLTFIFWLCLMNSSQGQAPPFIITSSHSFGGSADEELFAASKCPDGGFLLCGLTNSTDGDINQPMVYDTSNIFLVKVDSSGNKQWARTYGGNAYDKARFGIQDHDSSLVVTGTTFSTDGDVISTHGNSDIFLMKSDLNGNIKWFKTFGGTNYESARFVKQLADGNYIIGGYTASHNFDVPVNRGQHDGWLMKTDTAGNIIWSKTYGGSGTDRIRWIEEADNGDLLFAGSSSSNDLDCIGGHGDHDFWAGRTDALGTLIWSYVYGGSGPEMSYQIQRGNNNSWVVTGYTGSNDGQVAGYHGGLTDGWVIRIDDSGNLIDNLAMGGSGADRLYRTVEKPNGQLLCFGFAQSSDQELSGVNLTTSNQFWLSSRDNFLQQQWAYCAGGAAGDFGNEMLVNDQDGSIVLIGDSNSGNGNVIGNHGGYDFWFVKITPSASGIQSVITPGFSVSLNEASAMLLIQSNKSMTGVHMEIQDITGKILLHRENMVIPSGKSNIDIRELLSSAEGVYIAFIGNETVQSSTKIIRRDPQGF